MKTRTTTWLVALTALAGTCLTGCKDNDNPKEEILRPLAQHLTGTWQRAQDFVLTDGKWKEDPIPEGKMERIEFRADGKAVNIRTAVDGLTEMKSGEWKTDEEACTVTLGGFSTPVWRLTADEFGNSYDKAIDPATGGLMDGSFRWIYRRVSDRHPVEQYLGKWLLRGSYQKQDGEWKPITYGVPDEGWSEYKEDGTVTTYSRTGDKEQGINALWAVNCNTGTMVWYRDPTKKESLTVTTALDDDTMTVFYSQNFDPATGGMIEGEFKDGFVREK